MTHIQELIAQMTPTREKFHGSPEEEICGLCESSEKILDAYAKGDVDNMRKKTTGALIGALTIRKSLGVQNPGKDSDGRMEEIMEQRKLK